MKHDKDDEKKVMTVQEKREALARAVVEQCENDGCLYKILMYSCTGYNEMSNDKINYQYGSMFGE